MFLKLALHSIYSMRLMKPEDNHEFVDCTSISNGKKKEKKC
jgi:hypothetical protein